MIVDVDYPTRGTYQTVGCPVKLSDSPAEVTRPPLLGEHTAEVLAALCGVSADDVQRLRDAGRGVSGVTHRAIAYDLWRTAPEGW